MSTGIILGLGLLSIVVAFYLILNMPYWMVVLQTKRQSITKARKYHHWVYEADDAMNNALKTLIYGVYAYGAYVVFAELWTKFV